MYKPVILIGDGCRYDPAIIEYLCSLSIPVLTTLAARDLVADDNPAYCGRVEPSEECAANIILEKAEVLFMVGAGQDGEHAARNTPNALKIVYEDDAESSNYPKDWVLSNNPYSTGYLMDLRTTAINKGSREWLDWCKDQSARHPDGDEKSRD